MLFRSIDAKMYGLWIVPMPIISGSKIFLFFPELNLSFKTKRTAIDQLRKRIDLSMAQFRISFGKYTHPYEICELKFQTIFYTICLYEQL